MLQDIIAFRKELHQFPELSGKEASTAQRVKNFCEKFHPTKIIENFGHSGLAVIYDFDGKGKTIMIRCELDALPIHEENNFTHRSTIQGISHKCGHDGHMAIVVGLIGYIKQKSFQGGKIVLLFQPAEETGKGAKAILDDPKFENIKPDYVLALHNIPGVPLHTIIALKNNFSPSVQSLAIELIGKESHASEPENGINPAVAISNLIQKFETFQNPDLEHSDFALLTPVHLDMGKKAYGISAGKGSLHYTIRTRTEHAMSGLVEKIEKTLNQISKQYKLKSKIDWFEYFPSTKNDDYCNQLIINAAEKNNFPIQRRKLPFKFGEDFGWFSQRFPSAMFGLGAGEDSPALHHAEYDFPDELIPTGIRMFASIIEQILK